MSDIEFVPGLYAQRNEKAPDYVLVGLSYPVEKIEDHIAWLREQAAKGEKYINVQVKRAKSGKVYAALDTWKPDGKREAPRVQDQPRDFIDDELPPF